MSDNAQNDGLFDALFAVAARQAALERLDETVAGPEDYHTFSPAYEKRKQVILRRHRAQAGLKNALSVAKKVAIIALVVLAITSGALMTVEAVRNEIVRVVIEWFDKFATVGFVSEIDTEARQNIDLRQGGMLLPSYIPEGYELVESDGGVISVFALYQNAAGEAIVYEQCVTSNGDTLSVDNEHHTFSTVSVNGREGVLAVGDTSPPNMILIWHDGIFSFFIVGCLTETEIFLMAESLK